MIITTDVGTKTVVPRMYILLFQNFCYKFLFFDVRFILILTSDEIVFRIVV